MRHEAEIILASGSPRRSEILKRHDVAFRVIKSDCDEDSEERDPERLVMELSLKKAANVRDRLLQEGGLKENEYILAADTVVSIDGRVLGKPADEEEAGKMLALLSGRTHQVYTGAALVREKDEPVLSFAECTQVSVYPLTEEEIDYYIRSGEPMDKAGAYGIQGKFAIHIKEIRGDYDNVVGLPMARLYQACKEKKIWL